MHWTLTLLKGVGYDDITDNWSSLKLFDDDDDYVDATLSKIPPSPGQDPPVSSTTATNGDANVYGGKGAQKVSVVELLDEETPLIQCLPYQCQHPPSKMKSLPKVVSRQLKSSKCTTVPIHRDRDDRNIEDNDDEWELNYKRLKGMHDETGSVKLKARNSQQDMPLNNWVSRQRLLLKRDLLDPVRKERLEKLGIEVSKFPTRKSATMTRAGKKKPIRRAQWQCQFEKLKRYKQIHGDCNVPPSYIEDPSLGRWVTNQRYRRVEMRQGVRVMDPDRLQKLNEIGFEWCS